MPEAGGPTTQSGIRYQNSVAALFLGRLCDAVPRPDRERVVQVRAEAPVDVDDTVITFGDDHLLYIQAKENVRRGDPAWHKLWDDFDTQFHNPAFRCGHDRLGFYTGTIHDGYNTLKEICERAFGSTTYIEWWGRLTEAQREEVNRIRPFLRTTGTANEPLRAFFASIDLVIWELRHIEQDLVYSWIPPGNQTQSTAFRLLRDYIGGEARIRRVVTAQTLQDDVRDSITFTAPIDITDLRAAVAACGALLRQHKHTIAQTDQHIRRNVVADIIAWLRDTTSEQNVSMLLDQAGMGKTVVMRDVLEELEENGSPVLAIKVDQQLSGVTCADDLPAKLQIPETLERTVRRLTRHYGPVVVLIDQIDALSLSLARDQAALNVVLDLIARLRLIPDVRILVSCRKFDYDNDPRLNRMNICSPFHLVPLTDAEIANLLQAADVDFAALPASTQHLLRTPLHLDLFMQVFNNKAKAMPVLAPHEPLALTSLQELYHLLWRDVILKAEPNSPPPAHRVELLQTLTDYMNTHQQTSAPQALFYSPAYQYQHLYPSAQWLASAGILVPTPTDWTFLHQTFFDYCYARQLVEQHQNLVEVLLQSQGLHTRPRLLQILTYLRGTRVQQYLPLLNQLLNAQHLRYHLRDLLVRWLGALVNPTDKELVLAQRWLADSARRAGLLLAMHGNPGWLTRLTSTLHQNLLALDEQEIDTLILPYLASLIDPAQVEVVRLLRPYLGTTARWNKRIAWILLRIRDWQTDEVIALFEDVVTLDRSIVTDFRFECHKIATVNPLAGCRLLHVMLDLTLDQFIDKYQAQQQEPQRFNRILNTVHLKSELEHLSASSIVEACTVVSQAVPAYFVEVMVPWLERVLRLDWVDSGEKSQYSSDKLSHGWYNNTYVVTNTLIHCLITALTYLAQTEPGTFHHYTERLARLPYETPQQLLSHIYRAVPDRFAEEAWRFLLEDRRRFHLGDSERYDTRQLITSIYPYLTPAQRIACEAAIIAWTFDEKPRDLLDLRWRGIHQLMLLQAIPDHLLTDQGRRYVQELERKFPDEQFFNDPSIIHFRVVISPISLEAARRMSDRAWLRAMQHYQNNRRHPDSPKGGADELAGVLGTLMKDQPERFFKLLERMPDTIDDSYLNVYIERFAEADVSIDYLIAIIRRFGRQAGRRIRRTIHAALEKCAHIDLPDDILALLEDSIRAHPDDYEQAACREHKDLFQAYINTDRGTGLRALMRYLDQRHGAAATEKRWALIAYAANDSSLVLRAGAIEELLYMLRQDRPRAIGLFEQLVTGNASLLCTHCAGEFIYYSLYQQFARIQPYIHMVMQSDAAQCRQRGAELACIAALSPHVMETEAALAVAQALANDALHGHTDWRRGAARVYAANLVHGSRESCEMALHILMHDDDDEVRRHVSTVFRQLTSYHFFELQSFIEAYAASKSLYSMTKFFGDYLWENSILFPEQTLNILDIALHNPHRPDRDTGFFDGEEFIRAVLRVYTDQTADDHLRNRAMDLFDRLLEHYPRQAQGILAEWDTK